MRREDADQRERNRRHDHERGQVIFEPAHHQHIDQDHHHAEGKAQVPEYLQGNMPLSIPLHGRLEVVEGLVEVEELDLAGTATIITSLEQFQLVVHG